VGIERDIFHLLRLPSRLTPPSVSLTHTVNVRARRRSAFMPSKPCPDSVDDVPCSRDSQERQETVGSGRRQGSRQLGPSNGIATLSASFYVTLDLRGMRFGYVRTWQTGGQPDRRHGSPLAQSGGQRGDCGRMPWLTSETDGDPFEDEIDPGAPQPAG
jgi:hypothetical protein